jgi:N6-L-threonylcarbamoyladenine synthase
MPVILAIESSCDDTSAAICKDGKILANIVAGQSVHEAWGGVVPELASRAHMQNIGVVVDMAMREAGITRSHVDAIAFTRGPGLMGSLLVGTSFAKGLALALDKPLIAVHHMKAHVIANYIAWQPVFPHLCLTVSGGHTQIVQVESALAMRVIGETLDDAAGEAFDKTAKLLGLSYPGGPMMDKLAQLGDPSAFKFAEPQVDGLNFSFSGFKTSVLYFLQKQNKINPDFVPQNLHNLCAAIQTTLVDILIKKMRKAITQTGVKAISLAGGVSANSALRSRFMLLGSEMGVAVHIPAMEYCTDNAAMIALTGQYLYEQGLFSAQSIEPLARWEMV